ncbi:hypothetical protein BT96DRAFT_986624 [Gymnopus androsaceus JB14]|uniref:Uncharacterized protein n=1 Tax=Gymnopus androsaceus JB14 TaxID=1447944 RepID=A0A6A4IC11_9AGAR|nr:hypothetical protein BT96DRAFT_986624 [Gymnopus androsaceus JB14]
MSSSLEELASHLGPRSLADRRPRYCPNPLGAISRPGAKPVAISPLMGVEKRNAFVPPPDEIANAPINYSNYDTLFPDLSYNYGSSGYAAPPSPSIFPTHYHYHTDFTRIPEEGFPAQSVPLSIANRHGHLLNVDLDIPTFNNLFQATGYVVGELMGNMPGYGYEPAFIAPSTPEPESFRAHFYSLSTSSSGVPNSTGQGQMGFPSHPRDPALSFIPGSTQMPHYPSPPSTSYPPLLPPHIPTPAPFAVPFPFKHSTSQSDAPVIPGPAPFPPASGNIAKKAASTLAAEGSGNNLYPWQEYIQSVLGARLSKPLEHPGQGPVWGRRDESTDGEDEAHSTKRSDSN